MQNISIKIQGFFIFHDLMIHLATFLIRMLETY